VNDQEREPSGNLAFKAARGRRGWTQEEFAESFQAAARKLGLNLALSARQVRRWESDDPPWPQPPYRRVLEELFSVPITALGFTPPPRGLAPQDSVTPTPVSGIITRSAFLSEVHSPDVDDLLWAADATQTEPSTIAALWASIENYWRLDDQFGGKVLRPAIIGQLRYIEVLLQAGPDPQTKFELRVILQEFYRLAGWTHFDSRKFDAATRYFKKAALMARDIQDWPFMANVLACMSLQATYQDRPDDALALVQEAKDISRGTATPRVTAILSMREAFAHAVLKDSAACHRALAASHSSFKTAGDDDGDPPWARYFNETKLTVDTGIARGQLGENRQAGELIGQALAQEDESSTRVRAFHQLWLATTHFRAGELAEACRIAEQATRSAGHLDSLRIADHIDGFRALVLPRRAETPVAEFLTVAAQIRLVRQTPELTA
jgi:tetratricopeptide (TPR) repeat protein